jgi:WD40 repeat protein
MPARRAALLALLAALPAPAAAPPPPRLDAFGSPLPPFAVARVGCVRYRHPIIPNQLHWSPDGRLLGSAGLDRRVRLWDGHGHERARLYKERDDAVGFTFSPDGRLVATLHSDGGALLWTKEGRYIRNLGQVGKGAHLAFRADGKALLAAAGNERGPCRFRARDVQSGRLLADVKGPEGEVQGLTAAGDVLLAQKGGLVLWGGRERKARTVLPARSAVAMTPDARCVAGADLDGKVEVWANGRRHTWKAPESTDFGPLLVALSPDGRRLAISTALHAVLVLDVEGRLIWRQPFFPAQPSGLAFSPDGRTLAVGLFDGRIRLFEVATGLEHTPVRATGVCPTALAFTPDGRELIAAEGPTVRAWSALTGRPLRRLGGHEEYVDGVALSPDGKLLASTDFKSVRLWDMKGGRLLRETHGLVDRLVFAPDGKSVALGGPGGGIDLWGADGKRRVLEPGLSEQLAGLAFTSGGKEVLAVTRNNGTVCFRSPATGKVLHEWTASWGRPEAALSADGRWLAAGDDMERPHLRLWEARTGKEHTPASFRAAPVMVAVAFSPDGRRLATGGKDGTVWVWEVPGGRLLRRLPGHSLRVGALAFAPAGDRLASASADGTILVWRLP